MNQYCRHVVINGVGIPRQFCRLFQQSVVRMLIIHRSSSTLVAPSPALEFILLYGIDSHFLPLPYSIYLNLTACYNPQLVQIMTRFRFNENMMVTEMRRGLAVPYIGSAAKSITCRQSKISIQKLSSIPVQQCEYLSYLQSESTLTAYLNIQLGVMNISLDKTIMLPQCIFMLLTSLGLRGIVLAGISIPRYMFCLKLSIHSVWL